MFIIELLIPFSQHYIISTGRHIQIAIKEMAKWLSKPHKNAL